MSSLGELFSTYNQVIEQIIENDGEITADLEKQLEVTEKQVAQKVDNYVEFIKRLHSEIEYWKNKKKEIDRIKGSLETVKQRVEDRVFGYMTENEKKQLQGEEYKFEIRKSKPRVVIDDVQELPDDYKQIVWDYNVDKDKLRSDLEKGKVPGAHLEGGSYLKKSFNKTPKN